MTFAQPHNFGYLNLLAAAGARMPTFTSANKSPVCGSGPLDLAPSLWGMSPGSTSSFLPTVNNPALWLAQQQQQMQMQGKGVMDAQNLSQLLGSLSMGAGKYDLRNAQQGLRHQQATQTFGGAPHGSPTYGAGGNALTSAHAQAQAQLQEMVAKISVAGSHDQRESKPCLTETRSAQGVTSERGGALGLVLNEGH